MSTSHVLKSASVQVVVESDLVIVECEFEDNIEGASCVLVYRQYDSDMLIVKEYFQNSMFPATVTVSNLTSYTFAVFGKRGDEIEERSFMSVYNENGNPPTVVTIVGECIHMLLYRICLICECSRCSHVATHEGRPHLALSQPKKCPMAINIII